MIADSIASATVVAERPVQYRNHSTKALAEVEVVTLSPTSPGSSGSPGRAGPQFTPQVPGPPAVTTSGTTQSSIFMLFTKRPFTAFIRLHHKSNLLCYSARSFGSGADTRAPHTAPLHSTTPLYVDTLHHH